MPGFSNNRDSRRGFARLRIPILLSTILNLALAAGCAAKPAEAASAQAIAVAMSPASTSMNTSGTLSFTATVTGTTSTRVAWNVDGKLYGNSTVGTITGTGNTVTYTAPAVPGTHVVTAISDALNTQSASASVSVLAPAISVVASPSAATLLTGKAVSITATVSGSSDTAVTWSVDGIARGNATVGTITGTGNAVTYTAPATPSTHTVTATSSANSSHSATTAVTVSSASVAVALTQAGPTTVNAGGSVLFTAAVTGTPNTAVSWSVDGIPGGNATVGTLHGHGNRILYEAPATTGPHTVTAISSADAAKSASVALSVTATAFTVGNPSLTVNVKNAPYNAKGDGKTDDTAAIQHAIDTVNGTGGTVLIPDGVYMINPAAQNGEEGLMIDGSMTLSLSSGAVLQAKTNSLQNYFIVYVDSSSNVNIHGGTIKGDLATHVVLNGDPGESGMGIGVDGTSSHVTIEGVTIEQCWGDGIYITGSCSNVTVCGVVSNGNRRQGMSVTSCNGLIVRDSTFENTSGTDPQNGIDIEPNLGNSVTNLRIFNCNLTKNHGGGIQCGPATANMATSFVTNAIICYNTFAGNNLRSIEMGSCGGNTIADNIIGTTVGDGIMIEFIASDITVTGNTVTGSTRDGIFLAQCQGTLVTGNTTTGNGAHGINNQEGSGATVTGNTSSGNGMTP